MPPPKLPSHRPTIGECRHDHPIWSSLELQLRHANCHLDSDRTELLVELQRKLNVATDSHYRPVWSSLRKWASYDVTASIVACSSYAFRGDFVRCGHKIGPFTFSCRDPLCLRCSYTQHGKPLRDEFGEVGLLGGEVFYLVVSLSRRADERDRLIFRDADRSDLIGIKRRTLVTPCSPEDYGVEFKAQVDIEQIRVWWEIIREEVRDFVTKGQRRGIRGAVGGPELAVQFTPLRVLPHANLVLWADHFTVDHARQLRRLITSGMRNSSRLHWKLHPTIACYRLGSPNDVRHVLTYSFKAIDLAGAYVRSAELAGCEPIALAGLNREVNQFLDRLPDVFHGVRRVERYGGCHAGSHTYFGVVTPWRAARLQREAERRRALRTRGNHKPAVRRRASIRRARFPFWFAATQPPPPPPLPRSNPVKQ